MFKAESIFVQILFPFCLGIGLFYNLNHAIAISGIWIGFGLLFSALGVLNAGYSKLRFYRHKGWIGLLFFFFFFTLGALFCTLNDERLAKDYFVKKEFSHVGIRVNDEPQSGHGIIRFKARIVSGAKGAQRFTLSGQLLVILKVDSLQPIHLNYGDELWVVLHPTEVEPPYNPAEFDFKAWLAGQNIYHQAFVNQDHLIKTQHNLGNPVLSFALKLRKKQVEKYRVMIHDPEAFAVASTLILGYRSDLSKETLSAYSKTGTIHALSVSGAHVAIVYVVLNFLLQFLDRSLFLKSLKLLLICGLIWFYALLTGLSPSVVRSAIMITIFILANTYAQNKNSYNILAFAAFCQLLHNPFLLWDVGFQLSYLAVFGLLYLQPKIYSWIYLKFRWADQIWNYIALSLAAQLVTFPLSIYYFHQFPLYFLFGNLFITIPLVVVMYLGILILIPGFGFLSPVLDWTIKTTNLVLHWISDLPFSTISSLWITKIDCILLSFSLALFIYALSEFQKKLFFTAAFIFSLYLVDIAIQEYKSLHQKKILFFSLRKGYAVAFINSHKAVLVTDLIDNNSTYRFMVKPALDLYQVAEVNTIRLGQDTLIRDFIAQDHQMVFQGYKIFILDQTFNRKTFKLSGNFSVIWLQGNPWYNLQKTPATLRYSSVVIDAGHPDYKTKVLRAFAEKIQINHYILKKNKAYLIDLKP